MRCGLPRKYQDTISAAVAGSHKNIEENVQSTVIRNMFPKLGEVLGLTLRVYDSLES